MSKSASVQESDQYIRMLNLDSKRSVVVTNLSGGMKRKVNLGIALIGGSKVVNIVFKGIKDFLYSLIGCIAG